MSLKYVTEPSGYRPACREELKALISLMDDPDPYVQQQVDERLSDLDEQYVPLLDELREDVADPGTRTRVTELIHRLTFPALELEFAEYLEKGVTSLADLEKGQLLLCRLDNPTLRTDLYRRQLDNLAGRLKLAMGTDHSGQKQMQKFVSSFFDNEYFWGTNENYSHPDNSFLHKVLQRRRGIPISLGMVLLFVSRRLGLPFYGINMPMHFLISFKSDRGSTLIDPFNGGRIVSLDQCCYFLRKSGITPSPSHFDKASAMDMLMRSIRNLIFGFDKLGEKKRVAELMQLLNYTSHFVE